MEQRQETIGYTYRLKMKYLEIGIKTKSETSELVADLLTELTGEGVCIYDKNDLSGTMRRKPLSTHTERKSR